MVDTAYVQAVPAGRSPASWGLHLVAASRTPQGVREGSRRVEAYGDPVAACGDQGGALVHPYVEHAAVESAVDDGAAAGHKVVEEEAS